MNKRSQKPFENSWAVTYRKPNYDALGDPHASYYFLGRSMKKHLLHLRKSIDSQGKHVQKKNINRMIGNRLKERNQAARQTKVQPYFGHLRSQSSSASIYNSTDLLGRQLSKQKSKTRIQNQHIKQYRRSKSKKRMKNRQTNLPKLKNNTIDVGVSRKQQNLPTNNRRQKYGDLQAQAQKVERLNKTQHKKFLTFLMNKRKTIETSMKDDPQTHHP